MFRFNLKRIILNALQGVLVATVLLSASVPGKAEPSSFPHVIVTLSVNAAERAWCAGTIPAQIETLHLTEPHFAPLFYPLPSDPAKLASFYELGMQKLFVLGAINLDPLTVVNQLHPDDDIEAVELVHTVEAHNPQPSRFALEAWPNPFNHSVTISWETPRSGPVTMRLYTMQGRLLEKRIVYKGGNTVHFTWNASEGLSSGNYFLLVDDGKVTKSRRLVFIK